VIDNRPGVRKFFVRAIKATGLYRLFKPLYQRMTGQSVAGTNGAIPTQADMSVRANRLYQDLKSTAERNKETS